MDAITNSVQLIGRLGNDPEIRDFESGKKMATFSMATNDVYYTKEGEKVTDTYWHNVVAWEKYAEKADNYLKKGSYLIVQGKLVNRTYEKDGVTKYVTEVILKEMYMLDKKEDS